MLKFRRTDTGYQADTDARRYVISKAGRNNWTVQVWKLLETAGVKHTIGLGREDVEADNHGIVTKALAVDIARRYDQLIREGYGRLFTDLAPITRASIDAHEADNARVCTDSGRELIMNEES